MVGDERHLDLSEIRTLTPQLAASSLSQYSQRSLSLLLLREMAEHKKTIEEKQRAIDQRRDAVREVTRLREMVVELRRSLGVGEENLYDGLEADEEENGVGEGVGEGEGEGEVEREGAGAKGVDEKSAGDSEKRDGHGGEEEEDSGDGQYDKEEEKEKERKTRESMHRSTHPLHLRMIPPPPLLLLSLHEEVDQILCIKVKVNLHPSPQNRFKALLLWCHALPLLRPASCDVLKPLWIGQAKDWTRFLMTSSRTPP